MHKIVIRSAACVLAFAMASSLQRTCAFQNVEHKQWRHKLVKYQSLGPSECLFSMENPEADSVDARTSTHALALTPSISRKAASNQTHAIRNRYSWNERIAQLNDYLNEHGTTCVPKRYRGHGNLGLWVSKQRLNYRKLMLGEDSSLTTKQIDILNKLDFCWEATDNSQQKLRHHGECEGDWWTSYRCLESLLKASGQTRVGLLPLSTTMRRWLGKQRKELAQAKIKGDNGDLLQRIQALEQIDPTWNMSRHDIQWELRFHELLDYRQTFGDFNVPISFTNAKLANWVSNQRKEFTKRQSQKPSLLTPQRLERLNAIGFVWNRWDDAFVQKEVYRGR
ncbi:hypothetical protein MPSEU_000493400 [Mayamaea pseudoterrestris]|nr:hypothetical protein MPSEU_000493400 [Mayamaea pseudoterrestris]